LHRAAVGFRVHSGWAAMVAVALEEAEPVILVRQRLQLVKTYSFTFRQPYHTAEHMEPADAAAFVRSMEKESRDLAATGIRAVRKELERVRYLLHGGALLLAAGRELPELPKILASHALIHTADGELFRESIRSACGRSRIRLTEIVERDLLSTAAQSLGRRPEFLNRKITALGKSLGPPWTQDEKLSALAAWLVVAS
jgi:hypothetical protein